MKEKWEDKRRKYLRHLAGKHTKECEVYLPDVYGYGCRYTRKLNWIMLDLMQEAMRRSELREKRIRETKELYESKSI